MLNSDKSTDLNKMIDIATDDIDLIAVIQSAIHHFEINLEARNEVACAEFRVAAVRALNGIQDPQLLKVWLPQVKDLAYPSQEKMS